MNIKAALDKAPKVKIRVAIDKDPKVKIKVAIDKTRHQGEYQGRPWKVQR